MRRERTSCFVLLQIPSNLAPIAVFESRIKKGEEFAVSLRKNKKQEAIMNRRRQNMMAGTSNNTIGGGESISDAELDQRLFKIFPELKQAKLQLVRLL